ncbi:aldo/keto reductase [Kaustia mangrovi]|nr:aldo/keto reductase [Kaustia mangrovi]
MQNTETTLDRRAMLASMGALALGGLRCAPAMAAPLHMRTIPATGEALPAIGMGSWITFNVGEDPALRAERTKVLEAFFARGGTFIDSSPMYGSSEAVIGHCLDALDRPPTFAATKVWTWLTMNGPDQMETSRGLWGVDRFDLMQIHNLLSWEGHLETLREDKAEGRIRYIGMTTSHGRRHDELEAIMESEALDFVQLTYNVADRWAEERLLPLAAERGIAVIVNRPFRGGGLFDALARFPLPGWADEIEAANWAQIFLKFIVSHPAVTCAIPATSRVDHMHENMGALTDALPDAGLRRRMIRDIEAL